MLCAWGRKEEGGNSAFRVLRVVWVRCAVSAILWRDTRKDSLGNRIRSMLEHDSRVDDVSPSLIVSHDPTLTYLYSTAKLYPLKRNVVDEKMCKRNQYRSINHSRLSTSPILSNMSCS